MGYEDESVAWIIPSTLANSQALSLLPPLPFFLSLTPPSKCSMYFILQYVLQYYNMYFLASLKVHIVPPSEQFYYRCSKEKKYTWIDAFLNCTGQFDISLEGKSCTEGDNWCFSSSVGPLHPIAANKLKASHPKFTEVGFFLWQNTFYWCFSTFL